MHQQSCYVYFRVIINSLLFFHNVSQFLLTYSLSRSATVHLYCAVEKRHMSANCLTEEQAKRNVKKLTPFDYNRKDTALARHKGLMSNCTTTCTKILNSRM